MTIFLVAMAVASVIATIVILDMLEPRPEQYETDFELTRYQRELDRLSKNIMNREINP